MAQIFQKKCDLCTENPGWHFCYECRSVLCKECRSKHDQFLPSHTMARLENVDFGYLNSFQCNAHFEEYVHFCSTCSSLSCFKCVTTNHKGHEFADIKDKIARDRKSAKQWLETLKDRENSLKEMLKKTISKTSETLTRTAENAEQEMDAVCDQMTRIISRSKHIAKVEIQDFKELQQQNVDYFIHQLNVILEKNSRLFSQMNHLLNETNDKLFYTGYKRLNLELEHQDTIPEEPIDFETPLFDHSRAYFGILEQIRAIFEQESQKCDQEEMLKRALLQEKKEKQCIERALDYLKRENTSNLKEISQLKMQLKDSEETVENLKKPATEKSSLSLTYSIPFYLPKFSFFCEKLNKETQTRDPLLEEEDNSDGFVVVREYICRVHQQRFTYYCKYHVIPICDLCKYDHETCNEIQPIEDVIDGNITEENKKIDCEVSTLHNIIFQVTESALCIIKSGGVNVLHCSVTDKQTNAILPARRIERTKIHCKAEIIEILKEINFHRKKMRRGDVSIVGLISANRELEEFMSMHAYKEDIKINTEKIQTAIENYRKNFEITEPKYILDTTMLQTATVDFILRFLYRALSLALTGFSSDLQVLNSIHLIPKLNLKIDGKRAETYIPGCTVLKNGQIALTDPANDRLIFIGNDGKQTQKHIQNKPYGIVHLMNNDFAITLYRQRNVCIIDQMSQMKVIKFSECGNLGGIASAHNCLVVRVNGFGFFKIDHKGNIIEKIRIANEDYNVQNVCCINDKIFFAKWNENKVYCCDFKGNIIWTFQNEHVLQAPLGITVDEQELVYVTGQYSKNIVVISSCGNYFRELICDVKPCSIHYSLATKQLLVCGFDGQALLYNVQKKNDK